MTTTTTTAESTTSTTTSPRVERALDNAMSIGRIWANHGISIGRSALAASAESLKLAIETLDDVKSRLNGEPEAAKSSAQKA